MLNKLTLNHSPFQHDGVAENAIDSKHPVQLYPDYAGVTATETRTIQIEHQYHSIHPIEAAEVDAKLAETRGSRCKKEGGCGSVSPGINSVVFIGICGLLDKRICRKHPMRLSR